MGITTLLQMTAFYIVKFVVYIAIILGAVVLGKKLGSSFKKRKNRRLEEKPFRNTKWLLFV